MENRGFRIVVENFDKLFKQFKRPNETVRDMEGNSFKRTYEMGGAPLTEPCKEIQISAHSNGEGFKIHASIYTAYKPGELCAHYKLVPPTEQLSKQFCVKKVGELHTFIMDDNDEVEYVVYQDDGLLGWLYIEAGGGGGFHSVSTPAITLTTLEKFESDIRKFVKIVEVTINAIYDNWKREAPDFVLHIRPQLFSSQESPMLQRGEIDKDLLKKAIQVEKPSISFADVGGQDDAKREIQGLSFALKNPALYKKWGAKPPKGVLLYGPPGTGKTLMAKALASEAEASFYHVKVSDVSSMWYGQSEKIMQAVFDLARENGPSIVFFDEVDAVAGNRNTAHEATQRTVAVLLENLDGLELFSNVMVVASTNRPEQIDPALKRPGRLDRLVEVPLPDKDGRAQIFTIQKTAAESIAERSLFDAVDWEAIVQQTERMSGADIAEIIRRALEEKVRLEGIGGEARLVTTKDIEKEIKFYERVKKSVNAEIGHYL